MVRALTELDLAEWAADCAAWDWKLRALRERDEREATMHIYANNNLQLASLGAVRNEVQEMAAQRAAEVRRKLASPSTELAGAGDGVQAVGAGSEDESRSRDEGPDRQADQEAGEEFGRLFSARA